MKGTDHQILALLARDGRMSYTDIGRETGLSTSAAQQRVRRLEQRGIVSGYQAVIDPAALGRGLTAFIQLRPLDPAADEAVPEHITSIPEVASCYSVAGDASYLVMVHVADTRELDALLTRIRNEANVVTVTQVVLTTHFQNRPTLPAA